MGLHDPTLFIHHYDSRHATHLQQLDFLAIAASYGMVRVGQTDERILFLGPLSSKALLIFWANDNDLRVTIDEVLVVLAQLRQMPTAIGSGKAAGEDKDNVLLASKISEANRLSLQADQCEIGGEGSGETGHEGSLWVKRKT